MRKAIMILGTILIAAVILISGSAVAWTYAKVIIHSNDCTNIDKILGQDDNVHATLGKNYDKIGAVLLDLDEGYEMPADQDFTVFADGSILGNGKTEYYEVFVSQDLITFELVGSDDDQDDHVFTTPDYGSLWRYIHIACTENGGDYHPTLDPEFGPEVDAVGWD
jgi:hypothetical protein